MKLILCPHETEQYYIAKKAFDCQYTYSGDKEEWPAECGDLEILYDIKHVVRPPRYFRNFTFLVSGGVEAFQKFSFHKFFVPNDQFPAQHVIDREQLCLLAIKYSNNLT